MLRGMLPDDWQERALTVPKTEAARLAARAGDARPLLSRPPVGDGLPSRNPQDGLPSRKPQRPSSAPAKRSKPRPPTGRGLGTDASRAAGSTAWDIWGAPTNAAAAKRTAHDGPRPYGSRPY